MMKMHKHINMHKRHLCGVAYAHNSIGGYKAPPYYALCAAYNFRLFQEGEALFFLLPGSFFSQKIPGPPWVNPTPPKTGSKPRL